jgi:hypothetical protein
MWEIVLQEIKIMKKILFLFITLNSFLSFSQEDSLIKKQFNETELEFIKKTYKWKKEEILIICFTQPSKNCHYDNNKNIKKYESRWEDFYKGFDLKNKKKIYIYSDKEASKKIIDNKKQFNDNEDFFYNKLFKNDNYCHGVVVINKEGKYNFKSGEYMPKEIQSLIDSL